MNKSYWVISFYYDESTNRMFDQDGDVVYDIFRFISPSLYNLYRELRGTYYVKDEKDPDVMYEFVFPYYEDEEWDDEI